MKPITIDPKECKRCENWPCINDCPADCLGVDEKEKLPYVTYPSECSFCGNCRISCPYGAITITLPMAMIV